MQSVDTAGGDRWWFFNNTATDAQINFKCAAINLPLVQHADTILSGYPSNELSIYEITGSAVKERVTSVSWDSTFMTLNPVNLADHRVTYKLLELQRDDSAYLRVIFTFNPRSPSNKRVGFLPLGNMAERRTP